jgi:putative selenium metabolism protein SsnA
MTLLLTGGLVVRSLDPARVEAADIVIEGERIARVGPAAGSDGDGDGDGDDREGRGPVRRIDCSGAIVIPGNVCAHTHAYSALARGMPYRLPPPTDFVEILQRVWWRLDRALDPASIRASALVAGLEALRAGTTTLVDHHASPNAIDGSLDIVADAFAELGVRSVLCYETTDRDGPERAAAGLAENARFLGAVAAGRRPLAGAMVGGHASFTLSDATLDAVADLARTSGAGLHIHAAEDAADEDDSLARTGLRVVDRLARAGALGERTLVAHGVHLDPAEVAAVRAAGATVAHNPRSNMNNGVGRAPVEDLGDRLALGTDGIGGDLFEETRAAFLRRREEDLGVGPDWAVGRLAAGARIPGRAFGEPLLGELSTGAPADLVVLDAPPPTPLDAATLAGHWIFGLSAAAVRDVVVNGELVIADRRSTRVDDAEVAAAAREAARRLWQRMDDIAPHPFAPARRAPVGGIA